ncbi:MAG TPA: RidA family protein [Candidatus Cloacimonadota bacterium]|nr:RidA family protein [Candidatus Cloacimonadota bacterium]
MRAVHTINAPKVIGPYSQATLQNGLLFVSGQIGIDPHTGEMGKSFMEEARLCFANLREILTEAGMSFAKVVKVTIFITDLNNFNLMNDLYAQFFSEPYPARETVQVAALPKNASIEISLIAMM